MGSRRIEHLIRGSEAAQALEPIIVDANGVAAISLDGGMGTMQRVAVAIVLPVSRKFQSKF